MIYKLDVALIAENCELCGMYYIRNPYDDDALVEARDYAERDGWLFNYDGKRERTICPKCQKQTKP